MQISIGRASEGAFTLSDIHAMHRLRHDVFSGRLGWEVNTEGGLERDDFDSLDPVYMMAKQADGAVLGCWRLLPTTGPYMMRDTFPQTLHGAEAPRDEPVWELSRFAMGQHRGSAAQFSEAALAMMECVVAWGLQNGLQRYVTVTTVAIERLMRTLGIRVQRMGPPVQIGIERTVALDIPLDAGTLAALRQRLAEQRLAVQAQQEQQQEQQPLPLAA
jgi:acyl homoserine lactone synthase